jgi:hypothetical protein
MASTMSQSTRDEYLDKLRFRYGQRTTKPARTLLIDEFCGVSGHERKYAIKLLRGSRGPRQAGPGIPPNRGTKATYGKDVVAVLHEIWRHSEQPCGKRLKPTVKLWLPAYEQRHGSLEDGVRRKVLAISAAQIDRVLAPRKASDGRRRNRSPKAASAIKALVPIRAEAWDVHEPGWLEADTVAHCGGDMGEGFVWSLTATDIFSGWTEVGPTWNRGQHGVRDAFARIEGGLPFEVKGVDTDNGGEFLNHHLHGYLTRRDRPVKMTRSRPYRKNDQAHVEQKNDTHVRQLLGYERLGHAVLVEPMRGLLEAWSLWRNIFTPTFKQIEKRREGSRTVRRHEKEPKTPCQRLIEHWRKHGAEQKALALEGWRAAHDPFELKDWIEARLALVWKLDTALRQAEAEGETDLEGVAAPIMGADLRSAPISPHNRERLFNEPKTINQNQTAMEPLATDPIAA